MKTPTSISAYWVLESYLNRTIDTAESPPVMDGNRRPQVPKSFLGIDLGLASCKSHRYVCLRPTDQRDYECSRKRNNDRYMVKYKVKEDVGLSVKERKEILKDVTLTKMADDRRSIKADRGGSVWNKCTCPNARSLGRLRDARDSTQREKCLIACKWVFINTKKQRATRPLISQPPPALQASSSSSTPHSSHFPPPSPPRLRTQSPHPPRLQHPVSSPLSPPSRLSPGS